MDIEINWEQTYSAAMDSVNLINQGKADWQDPKEWEDTVKRNVEHLKIILAKKWPKNFDLKPFQKTVSANG